MARGKRKGRHKKYAKAAGIAGAGILGALGIYALTRNQIKQYVAPLIAKVPMIPSVEAGMAIGSYFVSKHFVRNPLAKKVLNVMMIVEGTLAAQGLISSGLNLGQGTSTGYFS